MTNNYTYNDDRTPATGSLESARIFDPLQVGWVPLLGLVLSGRRPPARATRPISRIQEAASRSFHLSVFSSVHCIRTGYQGTCHHVHCSSQIPDDLCIHISHLSLSLSLIQLYTYAYIYIYMHNTYVYIYIHNVETIEHTVK